MVWYALSYWIRHASRTWLSHRWPLVYLFSSINAGDRAIRASGALHPFASSCIGKRLCWRLLQPLLTRCHAGKLRKSVCRGHTYRERFQQRQWSRRHMAVVHSRATGTAPCVHFGKAWCVSVGHCLSTMFALPFLPIVDQAVNARFVVGRDEG